MPETHALTIVLANRILTDQEWLRLLEHRVNALRPHLDRIAFRRLDSVEFTTSDLGNPMGFSSFDPRPPASLAIRGAFAHLALLGQRYVIWGLARDGKWVSVSFGECTQNRRCSPFRSIDMASLHLAQPTTALSLHVKFGISYRSMWRLLGNIVKECAEYRRQQLSAIEPLERRCHEEDALVDMLSGTDP